MNSMTTDPAVLVAMAEDLVPSLNGASTQRFAEALELALNGLLGPDDETWLADSAERVHRTGAVDRWAEQLAVLEADGVHLVTVCDATYPSNLRMISDRPPLLFVRSQIVPADDRAIAMVGTRKPSSEGRRSATTSPPSWPVEE